MLRFIVKILESANGSTEFEVCPPGSRPVPNTSTSLDLGI